VGKLFVLYQLSYPPLRKRSDLNRRPRAYKAEVTRLLTANLDSTDCIQKYNPSKSTQRKVRWVTLSRLLRRATGLTHCKWSNPGAHCWVDFEGHPYRE